MKQKQKASKLSTGFMCNPCRFVGLLLVTKLLPAGDADTIRAVYDSVGIQFIARLLLPLRRPQVGFSEDVFTAILVGAIVALNSTFPHADHRAWRARQAEGWQRMRASLGGAGELLPIE